MKVEATIKYNEEYLPTKRHRIPRIREVEETVAVELREVNKADAKLALVVTDYQSFLDENGKDCFAPRDTAYFAIGDSLFTKKKDMHGALDRGDYLLDDLISQIQEYGVRRVWCLNEADRTKDYVLKEVNDFVDQHLVIDGDVYTQSGEPRYVIHTFGLGHNHGGTSLSITNYYNPNIGSSNYFNALQRGEAVAYAKQVAARRGDTDYIAGLGKNIDIKVYMPEIIRCNPQAEHGEGSPLLNSFEALVQSSNSSLEAGLFVLSQTAANMQEPKKSPLDSQIQSAAVRAQEGAAVSDSKDKTINVDKLNEYLENEMILEFSSPEECLNYFNTYDSQHLKSVEELKAFQGEYGFGVGDKWYHICFDEALDVRQEAGHIHHAGEDHSFSETKRSEPER